MCSGKLTHLFIALQVAARAVSVVSGDHLLHFVVAAAAIRHSNVVLERLAATGWCGGRCGGRCWGRGWGRGWGRSWSRGWGRGRCGGRCGGRGRGRGGGRGGGRGRCRGRGWSRGGGSLITLVALISFVALISLISFVAAINAACHLPCAAPPHTVFRKENKCSVPSLAIWKQTSYAMEPPSSSAKTCWSLNGPIPEKIHTLLLSNVNLCWYRTSHKCVRSKL